MKATSRSARTTRPGSHSAARPSRALVPLDTARVRKQWLRDRDRAEKALWRARTEWEQYVNVDQPAYHQWHHGVGGALRAELERLQAEQRNWAFILDFFEDSCDLWRLSPQKYVARFVTQLLAETGLSAAEVAALPCAQLFGHVEAFAQQEVRRWEANQAPRGGGQSSRADEWDEDAEWAPWDRADPTDDGDDVLGDRADFPGMDDLADELGGLSDAQREFVEAFLGRRVGVNRPPPKSLKSLYRDLCRKLHPDAAGELTPARRALWDQVQRAYAAHDVEALEALLARVEMDIDPSAAAQAAPSRIAALVKHLKEGLLSLRALIRRGKRAPDWGFTAWTVAQREREQARIAADLKRDRLLLAREVDGDEAFFRQMLGEALRSARRGGPRGRAVKPRAASHGQMTFDLGWG